MGCRDKRRKRKRRKQEEREWVRNGAARRRAASVIESMNEGKRAREAGRPRENPYDEKSLEGLGWFIGYDGVPDDVLDLRRREAS
jgi:hypothetical protein